MIRLLAGAALLALSPLYLLAQENAPAEDWHHQDPQQDNLRGVSTHRAYQEILSKKTPKKKVVVAVIDSGIDIEHEDLKDVIWVNEDEIAGNGIDDDKNGYVDDINGWNFIGGPDGAQVAFDQLEITREYVKYKVYFDGKDTEKLSKKDQALYAYYQQVTKMYTDELSDIKSQWEGIEGPINMYIDFVDYLKEQLGKDAITAEDVEAFDAGDNQQLAQGKGIFLAITANGASEQDVRDYKEYFESQLKYYLNTEYDGRSPVGDTYTNTAERIYGNNLVEGPDASHGTHVAGIIGAVRGNGIGMDGIADNVQIMVIRCVPDGDERDKDVANAIRYAADNGAQVINMSFGKALSPEKEAVDAAVEYAVSKGVLLIHAAGNDGKDIDPGYNYPRATYLKKGAAKLWIEVGNSGWDDATAFVNNSSNYGQTLVNLFAPGTQIYSTTPDNNYARFSGTSMAAPVVAGCAAVLLSYYPELSPDKVRSILLESVVPYKGRMVNKPGSEDGAEIDFGLLSTTGGIVNLYNAVQKAEAAASN